MSRVAASARDHLCNFSGRIEKVICQLRENEHHENEGVSRIPVDILEIPREFIIYIDVPGLSKSDIQVTVENEKILVIRGDERSKPEDGMEEGYYKYLKQERRAPQKLLKKYELSEKVNVNGITAKCENGVLTINVEKHPPPPPPPPKTVEIEVITIS